MPESKPLRDLSGPELALVLGGIALIVLVIVLSSPTRCDPPPLQAPDTGMAAYRFCRPHGGIVQLRYGPAGYGVRCRDRSWFWREKGRVHPIKYARGA